MILRLFISIIITITLAGCYKSKEDKRIDRAKREIAQLLNDPESAKFRNLRIVGDTVCGEFDGKNGFGGYTGYRKFGHRVLLENVEGLTATEDTMEVYGPLFGAQCGR